MIYSRKVETHEFRVFLLNLNTDSSFIVRPLFGTNPNRDLAVN